MFFNCWKKYFNNITKNMLERDGAHTGIVITFYIYCSRCTSQMHKFWCFYLFFIWLPEQINKCTKSLITNTRYNLRCIETRVYSKFEKAECILDQKKCHMFGGDVNEERWREKERGSGSDNLWVEISNVDVRYWRTGRWWLYRSGAWRYYRFAWK